MRLPRFRRQGNIGRIRRGSIPPSASAPDRPGGCGSGSSAQAGSHNPPAQPSRPADQHRSATNAGRVRVLGGEASSDQIEGRGPRPSGASRRRIGSPRRGGLRWSERDFRPRSRTVRPMSALPQMTYGLRMTPNSSAPRPSPRDGSIRICWSTCGHSEFVHGDYGTQFCSTPCAIAGVSSWARRWRIRRGLSPGIRARSGGLGTGKKPQFLTPRSPSEVFARQTPYPTGRPINRLSNAKEPTITIPMSPRQIPVLTLSDRCCHRLKPRSHHLSSPIPSRSSMMLPHIQIRRSLEYRRGSSTTSVLRLGSNRSPAWAQEPTEAAGGRSPR